MTGIHIGPEGWPDERRTLAVQIMTWCRKYLLQPDGPRAGEPWQFTGEQARFLAHWYAIDERGRFIYRSGVLRRMKGWGKDPLGAILACVELVGPCRFREFREGFPFAAPHDAAWIVTAAVSQEQTRNTTTLLPAMFSERARAEYQLELRKTIIYARGGRARLEAVTSSPLAMEGHRPTFSLKNETQHWKQSNEGHAMAAVIARNAAKSRDGSSRVLAITNAHNPGEDSDAERDYEAYLRMASGKSRLTGLLYDSLEAPPDTDLADPESLRAGILAARGDSEWVDPDRLMAEVYDPRTPPSTSRRFYLNQCIATEDAWLTPQEWGRLARPGENLVDKEIMTLGLDGSKSGDHTVLSACRVSDGHFWPLGIWDPAEFPENLIPTDEVDKTVRAALARYDVVGFYSDVHEWESYTDAWEQEFGEQMCARATDRHPIKWDMRRSREAALAAQAYHDAIVEQQLTHSDDPRMNQYHLNARRRLTNIPDVVTFAKESPLSARKVDGVAANLLAWRARQDYLVLPENRKRQQDDYAGVFFA